MVMVEKGARNNSHYCMIMNTSRLDDNRLSFCFEMLQPYFRHKIGMLTNAQQKKEIIKWCHDKTENYGFIFIDTLNQKLYHCKNKLK